MTKGRNPRGRGALQGPVHPGRILAQALDETPPSVAAKWFGLAPDALERVLSGEAPFTEDMAKRAGEVFGTGSAPWLSMLEAREAQSAPNGPKS